MPTPQLDAGANIAPAGHPEAVATAPTSSAETGVDDCDDGVPCWCGEASPLYDDEGLDATCGGRVSCDPGSASVVAWRCVAN